MFFSRMLRSRKLGWGLGCTTLILVVLLLLLGSVIRFSDRVIFRPPHPGKVVMESFLLELPDEAGAIRVCYSPAPPGGITILYSHGNAQDLGTIWPQLGAYRKRGYGVLAYDYEGYGGSTGQPSEMAVYRDAERCWQFLTEEKGISPKSIALCGHSLGTGPSVWLATRHSALSLELDAPFTSTFAVAGLGWLPKNRFPNLKRIKQIIPPLLIVHGNMDQVIPYRHGIALFDNAPEPKRFLEIQKGSHTPPLSRSEYWTTLQEFLDAARSYERSAR